MSRAFRAVGGQVRMQLDPTEVDLLRSLHRGLVVTLEEGDDEDPVIQRLFPSAVVGDVDADAEVRRLMRDELLASRRAGLEALIEILDRAVDSRGRARVDLDDDEPQVVLGTLNDLRLAIGARIGIEQIDRRQLDEDTAHRVAVMDHLGWLQEQLLAVIDPESVAVHQEPFAQDDP